MPKPAVKVELGFGDNAPGNWFTLDSATRGVLDNSTYTLSGAVYYDVTQYLTEVSTARGKSRELDRFNAGRITARFDNRNRYFDPTFAASPFYGQIVPRRDIRFSAGGTVQFTGITDDWNLTYTPDGASVAEVTGFDGFSLLASQKLAGGTATSQLSGARINAVLSDSNVNWSATTRLIDAGQETLQADVIPANQEVVPYINLIEQTEPGVFFLDKSNNATFKDRASVLPSSSAVVLADDGSGIAYSAVNVVYGSELLYNQVTLSRANGGTVITSDATSQAAYGIRNVEQTGLLHTSDANMTQLATYLVNTYKNPEFRFESMDFILNDLSAANQAALLGLEIGSVCKIVFTPNGIAPSITKYAEVLGVNNTATTEIHRMTVKFQTLDTTSLVLDDVQFGLLDLNSLGY